MSVSLMFLVLRAVDGDPWFSPRVSMACEIMGLPRDSESVRKVAVAAATEHAQHLCLRSEPDEVATEGITDAMILQTIQRLHSGAESIAPLESLIAADTGGTSRGDRVS